MKPARLRQVAEQDIAQAFNWYLREAGSAVAVDFVEAIDTMLTQMMQNPAAGSPRYGDALGLPGLRSWLMSRFPYTAIYVERSNHLDILRVLHQQTDIPAHLQDV